MNTTQYRQAPKSSAPLPPLFDPARELEQLIGRSGCYCFAYDYRSRRFPYVSAGVQRILGYDRRAWQIGGLDALLQAVHPADRHALQQVNHRIANELQQCRADERSDLSFVYALRLITADGRVLHLSHHVALLQLAPDGTPLSAFTMVTDITPFRQRPECRLHVRQRGPEGEVPVRTIPLGPEPETDFTPRECEVLKLVARGLSSREIARRLFISYNTVCTHRKNLLRKADVGCTVELIDVAREMGLVG